MTKQMKWTNVAMACAMVMTAAVSAARAEVGGDDQWKNETPEKQLEHAVYEIIVATSGRGGDVAALAGRCVRFADRLVISNGAAYEVPTDMNLGAKDTRQRDKDYLFVAPVGAIKARCEELVVKHKLRSVINEASGAKSRYKDWFGREVDAQDLANTLGSLAQRAKECSATMDAFLAGGGSPTQMVTVDNDAPVAASELKARYCAPLADAVQKQYAAIAAAEEAQIAPYRKVLKGDKLDLLLRRYMWSSGAYGKGCRTMNTPAAFAKAKVWYEILIDENGVLPRWTTRAYNFKGDKLSGQKERTGRGSSPPSSACP